MLELNHFESDLYGEVFDESDRLLVDAAIRVAGRLDGGGVEVSADLYRALLLLAKALRHGHAAVDLAPERLGQLVQDLWTRRDDEGEFEFVGEHVEPEVLIDALLGADPRLVEQVPLDEAEPSRGGSPFVLSTSADGPRFASTRRLVVAEAAIASRLLEAAANRDTHGAAGGELPAAEEALAFARKSFRSPELDRFVEGALTRKISVLTGGPGTGKTTAIAELLRSLGLLGREMGRSFHVAICAPTAKAAVRMQEALNQAFGDGGMNGFSAEVVLDPHSGSVHRLLGIRPDDLSSRVELRADLVVVDEVSMLELPLLDHLLEAAASSHVVLVGDPEQLPSVDVGAVLRDLVEAGEEADTPLEPLVTRLTIGHRSTGPIEQLAKAVNEGDLAAIADAFEAFPDALRRAETADGEVPVVLEHADALGELARSGDVEASLERLGELAVLCGNRRGDGSVAWWRAKVEDHLGRRGQAGRGGQRLAVGTPIMVRANEQAPQLKPEDRIANGDVGIVLESPRGPEAVFPPSGRPRIRPLYTAGNVEPAWAFTIHKSQGSEFDHVVVSLPRKANRVLSRELLYTAVTRAKGTVTIVGPKAVFEAAIARRLDRVSSLGERTLALAPRSHP